MYPDLKKKAQVLLEVWDMKVEDTRIVKSLLHKWKTLINSLFKYPKNYYNVFGLAQASLLLPRLPLM